MSSPHRSFGDSHSGQDSSGIPLFNKHGTALSAAERNKMAMRKGICVRCGIRTHELKGIVRRIPLDNENVHRGTCIRCNPQAVPPEVYAKWEGHQSASSAAADQTISFGAAARAATFVAPHLHPSARHVSSGSGSDRRLRSGSGSDRRLPKQSSDRSQSSSGDDSIDAGGLVPRGASGGSLHDSGDSLSDSFDHLSILKGTKQGSGRSVGDSDSMGQSSLSHLSLLKKKSTPTSPHQSASGRLDYSMSERPEQSERLASRVSARSSRFVKSERTARPLGVAQQHRRGASFGEDVSGGPFASEDASEVVNGMRENRDSPDVLKHHLHRLRNLQDEQVGALYEIKDLMDGYPNESRLLAVACGAVWSIVADDDDKKAEALESGVVKNIISALHNSRNRGNDDFCEWGIGSLACLARGLHSKAFIGEAGAIEAIIDIMDTHMESPGVFEWSCRALHALVHQYDDEGDEEYQKDAAKAIEKNALLIEEAGGISKIVEAMEIHSTETIAEGWAIKLLFRLLDQGDTARVLHAINDSGGMHACIAVLKADSVTEEVFGLAVELMITLLSEVHDTESLSEISNECVPAVARIMKDHSASETVQESACRVLIRMERAGRLNFKESGAVKEVVAAMGMYKANLVLQEDATSILWSMSFVPAFFDGSCVKDAIMALSKSTKAFPDSASLQTSASGFIANVSLIPDMKMADIPLDIPFRAILSGPGDDGAVFAQGCRALAVICSKVPAKIDRFMGSDEVNSLVDLVKNPDVATVGYVCRALAAIARTKDKNRSSLVEMGCVDAGMKIMKDAEFSPEMKHVLDLVASLVCPEKKEESKGFNLVSALVGGSENKVIATPPDLMPIILDSVIAGSTNDDAIAEGCRVMATVLYDMPPESVSFDVDALVNRMVELLNTPDGSVGIETKQAACEVLWVLVSKFSPSDASDLMPMFESIVYVMESHQGKDDTAFESDLQSSAAGALGAVTNCMQEGSLQADLVKSESMDSIVSVMCMAMEFDKHRIELLEKLLNVILNLSAVAPSLVIQCGGVVLVIDTMIEYEQYLGVQEKGSTILALLLDSEDLQVKLAVAESDGIDALIGALATFNDNERIVTEACKALSHLSEDQECRLPISSQGGLMMIVNAMKAFSNNVDLLLHACAALSNLSSTAEEKVLSAAKVLETVLDSMKRQKSVVEIQEKGLGVLKSLSMKSKDMKRDIAKSGGIDVVISIVKEFVGSPRVLEHAFTAMWSFAVLDYNQMSIGRKGGINPVINGMFANVDDADVQKQGCGCLCTLATNSDNKTTIREVGGADAIVFGMLANYRSEPLQAEACRVLSSLAVNMETNEVMLAGDSEISAIMSAMRHFPSNGRIQECACAALRNFMLSADNVELIKANADELMTLLGLAASNFPDQCGERVEEMMDLLFS